MKTIAACEEKKKPKPFCCVPDENFSFKQDQSSSHRNAEHIFIEFITIRGIVQDQHVCTPSYCRVKALRLVSNVLR